MSNFRGAESYPSMLERCHRILVGKWHAVHIVIGHDHAKAIHIPDHCQRILALNFPAPGLSGDTTDKFYPVDEHDRCPAENRRRSRLHYSSYLAANVRHSVYFQVSYIPWVDTVQLHV